MYLYLISQDVNDDYDTFDSAVVVAENEQAARYIHPRRGNGNPWWNVLWYDDENRKGWFDKCGQTEYPDDTWARYPEEVKIEEIGTAALAYQEGTVIIASFRAG